MAREDQHFRLRIPDALKAMIEEEARRNRRSMTAEMVARLEASFEPPPDDAMAIIREQAKIMDKQALMIEDALNALGTIRAAIEAKEAEDARS